MKTNSEATSDVYILHPISAEPRKYNFFFVFDKDKQTTYKPRLVS
jgi:hypothetical protein